LINMRFLCLSNVAEPDRYVAEALPWVHEAGCPYVDWFFDGREAARAAVEEWMHRPSSELFIGNAVLLMDGDRSLGGFIALGGADLRSCRAGDMVAAASAVPEEQREAMMGKVMAASPLFAPTADDEFYLSKIGVVRAKRGAWHGSAILSEYLLTGARAGYRRFRLDVSADNTTAIQLYRSVGFEAEQEGSADGMRYLSMALYVS
jgi:ribosomal protein S18 acetylase RimI-like enzyme